MASYPPPHHILSDLRITADRGGGGELKFTAPMSLHAADASGAMATGPIVAVADFAAASIGMRGADGDWVGTIDLSFRRAAPVVEGPLVITGSVVRAGGRLIAVRCELHDGRGSEEPATLAGTATGTFRRMRRDLGLDENLDRTRHAGRQDFFGPDAGFAAPVNEAIGAQPVSPGILELEKSPYVTNSFGTVNGGTLAILVAAAAESAVDHQLVAADLEIRYIGQAGVGPVRTATQIVRETDDHAVVDVTVNDLSNDHLPIALAAVTLVA